MRIEDAFKAVSDISVDFGGGNILNVTYRRTATTFKELTSLLEVARGASSTPSAAADDESEAAQIDRAERRMKEAEAAILGEILKAVEKWDLEDENGIVPLTREALVDIPTEILTRVLSAIKAEQKAPGGK